MSEEVKATRLSKATREFNVGLSTIVEFLHKKGFDIEQSPNAKIPPEAYSLLVNEYRTDYRVKKESENIGLKDITKQKESLTIATTIASPATEEEVVIENKERVETPEVKDVKEAEKLKETVSQSEAKPDSSVVKTKFEVKEKPTLKVVGKIELGHKNKSAKGIKKVNEDIPTEPEQVVEQKIETEVVAPETKEQISEVVVAVKEEQTNDISNATPTKEPTIQNVEAETTKEIVVEDTTPDKPQEPTIFRPEHITKISGPTVVGKIDLPVEDKSNKQPKQQENNESRNKKKKRKRIIKDTEVKVKAPAQNEKKDKPANNNPKKAKKKTLRVEVNEKDVQKQVKETLAKLTSKTKSKGAKYRKEKRELFNIRHQEDEERQEQEKRTLKVTEFVSANELAIMMNVPVTEIISTCMGLGLFVSINQRLDAETMSLLADGFGYNVEFVSAELQEAVREEEDKEEDLKPRQPIVTVMGHVDHGKTKLLDYIRRTNVIAGEAGGITQHIGAYAVELEDGKKITFLDTPGHEAFTAMRARGAQITDIAIIVIAADDGVMPQTIEAINHASAAGVPIVFAINKIDKPAANPEKIREELAQMNYLVEDWGGKYQSQCISAKGGLHIEDLLDKVLLEAELLELKANPDKAAVGTIIESSLDKGRGYVATVLVKGGTLRVGDMMLAGSYYGHIKAMYNERGNKIDTAGPATPALVLGLNGAPQAGDNFNIMAEEHEAKEIATKRAQLQREQGIRTQKHITLDEIGRRIAIGNFKELNIIIKGDVDGSVEALSDSLIKLSTNEIEVNIIHKAVGQISESDILLAAASNAIIVGFQVRPSLGARKLAEKEQIDVRLYSIIYTAIEEIKAAMEGMLSPEEKEEIVATLEVRDTFKVGKVGTVAGCYVKEGKIARTTKVRVVRDGVVVYTGELDSLKRFKDDVKEVIGGYECGLNIRNFNDIKVGDIIEGYTIVEVKKTL